ncbi:MAG: chemotaxis protein CheW [Deltaproteobacteria bacterium]|nr:chemotaxis protein CheW [Deltaproteobacteria bacterium]
MTQVATFYIGDEIFGVDILLTKEIGRIPEITKVPQSPEFILGLMNLRGQVVTILDPGVFLEQGSKVDRDERRFIILKTEEELEGLKKSGLVKDNSMAKDPLAIVIDKIGDVVEIEETDILPTPPNLTSTKKEFVSGIIQQEKNLIILLAISKLVSMCIEKKQIAEDVR